MDAHLKARWAHTYPAQLGREMGLKGDSIRIRGKRLGLVRHSKLALNQPPEHEWLATASQIAQEANIRPASVVGWDMSRQASQARWKAWAAMLQSGKYTIAGIARTSGVHHTSILHAMKKMKEAARNDVARGADLG